MSELTLREAVGTIAASTPGINAVYDADTVDAPDDIDMPFVVQRWYDQDAAVGRSKRRPFDLWVYVPQGNRQPGVDAAAAVVARLVDELTGAAIRNGHVTQIDDLGIGGDLRDDDYDALVVVWHLRAVASGD